jgi:hypothetical protein
MRLWVELKADDGNISVVDISVVDISVVDPLQTAGLYH